MRRLRTRPIMSAVAVAVTGVLLAGCFSVEAKFDIHDDGTADLDFVTLVDTKQIEQFAGMLGEDAEQLDGLSGDDLLKELTGDDEDPCADFVETFEKYNVESREINENGQVGVGCTAKNIPLDDLTNLGDEDSAFTITQDDKGTHFSAVLKGVDELAGDPAETEQMTAMLGTTLDDLFSIKFTVSAPGSLGDNNATSTDGSTATWDIKPDSGFVANGDATMNAEWTGSGSGSSSSSSTLWIILAVIAVIAIVAAAVVWSKRKKSTPPATGIAGTEPTMAATPPVVSPLPPTGTTPPPAAPPAPPAAGDTPPPPPPIV